MAKLDKTGIGSGKVITAAALTNVYDALGGTGATDIMISGTLSAMNGMTVSGSIIPHSGSAYNLGSGTYPWKDLHLSGSTIYLWSSAGTAETLSRGNVQNIKEGKPLRGKGSLSSATLQCNFIYRDDNTADGDSTNRIAFLNDRIYVAINNLYAWDAKYSIGGGNQISFGNYKKDDQAANYYFEGSISSNNTISANAFVGDGSQLSSVTAEWDGTHVGDATIDGTLTATDICVTDEFVIQAGVAPGRFVFNSAGFKSLSTISANDLIIGKSTNTVGAGSDYASILAGGDNTIGINADHSAILGGQDNSISAGHSNTFILGSTLTSTSSNTTYVEELNVQGNANINGNLSANAFVGDGSQLSSVTAEWDGTHVGDAEITGTLTAGALCADNIMYIYNGTYYSVEQQVAMLKTATGNLYNSITSNDDDISSINTSISGLETATGVLVASSNTHAYDILSLKNATGSIIAVQNSLVTATGNLYNSITSFSGSVQTSLVIATGNLYSSISDIKAGTSTGNYNAYNLTANKLYATDDLISIQDDVQLEYKNLTCHAGSVSAYSISSAGSNGDFYKGSTRLLAALETATGNILDGTEAFSGTIPFNGTISADAISGNSISAGYFYGDGSNLTNLPGGGGGGSWNVKTQGSDTWYHTVTGGAILSASVSATALTAGASVFNGDINAYGTVTVPQNALQSREFGTGLSVIGLSAESISAGASVFNGDISANSITATEGVFTGNTTPLLHVKADSSSPYAFYLSSGSNGPMTIFQNTGGQVHLGAPGHVYQLNLGVGGNVGIGTPAAQTNATAKLTVVGDIWAANGASVSAQAISADEIYTKTLTGANPGPPPTDGHGELWMQPLSACFLGATSGDIMNAMGSASSDIQTVLYGS